MAKENLATGSVEHKTATYFYRHELDLGPPGRGGGSSTPGWLSI